MEEVDGVGLGRDIEFVKVAEVIRGALAYAQEAAAAATTVGALLVDGFEDLEGRADAFAFLVVDEGAIFHAGCREEADVAVAGKFLGRVSGGGGVLWWDGGKGRWADGVEVVGYERFIGDEKEEGELLKNRYLCDAISQDSLGTGQHADGDKYRNT